jgi:hypothetical protein
MNTSVFLVFVDQMCTVLLRICISNHAFLICFKYKCHIINFLLTSLARCVQTNIGPQPFCTNLALRSRSVEKRPWSEISLDMPRKLIYLGDGGGGTYIPLHFFAMPDK